MTVHSFNPLDRCEFCSVPRWAVADGFVTNKCPATEEALKRIELITRLRDGEVPGTEEPE